MSDDRGGCLYDDSAEPQTLTDAELDEILALAAEETDAQLVPQPFTVVTRIRSANHGSGPGRMQPPYGLILHHTGGSFRGDLATLTKPAGDPAKSVSANDYITKDGTIYELCEFPKRAWHAGKSDYAGIDDWNTHGWGIEIENLGQASDPYPRAQIDAVVWRCRERRRALGITDPQLLARHRDICVPKGRKPDTSAGFPFAEVKRRVFAATDPTDHGGPRPDETRITPESPLLAEPRATLRQVQASLLSRPHGSYKDSAVRHIAKLYFQTARAAGLDPLLAVAQMVLETGNLTSAWSQPPHRNPAGIGVTGEPGAGISFPSWSAAVRAHTGRLLAYALPKGQENADQRALIEEALRWRPLPDGYRGVAPTLRGLTGKWATDPEYAQKVSRTAGELRGPGSV